MISLAVEARETETGTVTIPSLLTTETIALGPLRSMKNAINNLASVCLGILFNDFGIIHINTISKLVSKNIFLVFDQS